MSADSKAFEATKSYRDAVKLGVFKYKLTPKSGTIEPLYVRNISSVATAFRLYPKETFIVEKLQP